GGRQEAGGLSETARRGRRRGARDRRFAGRESNGKDRGSGKKRSEYAAHRSALEKNGESQVSLTDPDSRAMAAHTKVGVGYNIQVARSWRLRRSRSGFWRKMTKYSMNLHQIYRRSSIRRRFHTVCFDLARPTIAKHVDRI